MCDRRCRNAIFRMPLKYCWTRRIFGLHLIFVWFNIPSSVSDPWLHIGSLAVASVCGPVLSEIPMDAGPKLLKFDSALASGLLLFLFYQKRWRWRCSWCSISALTFHEWSPTRQEPLHIYNYKMKESEGEREGGGRIVWWYKIECICAKKSFSFIIAAVILGYKHISLLRFIKLMVH